MSNAHLLDVLASVRQSGACVRLHPDREGYDSVEGRLVAAVPSCSFVVVGTVRGGRFSPCARGDMCRMTVPYAGDLFEFSSRVIDALEVAEGGLHSWAIRATFPTEMVQIQRRSQPRVDLEADSWPVHIRSRAHGPSRVCGHGLNISVGGLLAEFFFIGQTGASALRQGNGARIVFGVPKNGHLTEADLDALASCAHRPSACPEPVCLGTPSGGAILDVPVQVVRLMGGWADDNRAAFAFSSVSSEGEESIASFVHRRLDDLA